MPNPLKTVGAARFVSHELLRTGALTIQEGADALRPCYHQTQGRDGYISLEVSPHLACRRRRQPTTGGFLCNSE
jgi:hypothetical protein